MQKAAIRTEMLALRKELAVGACLAWSLRIQEAVVRLAEFLTADRIGLYNPIGNEVFTEELFRTARQMGKTVTFPRVAGDRLEFVEVARREELTTGAFGILEPAAGRTVPVAELDLLVVPGVAFDLGGHRLGFGKGYYDRLLGHPGRRCVLVGLCFEGQLVASLPIEGHDIRMDLLVTEERTIRFDRASDRAVQEYYSFGGGPGL